jgi:hypothetical protein
MSIQPRTLDVVEDGSVGFESLPLCSEQERFQIGGGTYGRSVRLDGFEALNPLSPDEAQDHAVEIPEV